MCNVIVMTRDEPDFRVVETKSYVARCGHTVEYRVCEELVEGRWEGFVSGGAGPNGICWTCHRAK